MVINGKKFSRLIANDRIVSEVKRLGKVISDDFASRTPLIIVVLNGAFMFAADLVKELDLNVRISFIKLSSYKGMKSTGKLRSLIGLNEDVSGEDIILVEDIVDSGTTARQVVADLKNLGAQSISIVSLLSKEGKLHEDLPVNYVGFNIEDRFVVGYGLDMDGIGRNLKHIYALDELHN